MTCRCDLLWSWTSVELLADGGRLAAMPVKQR